MTQQQKIWKPVIYNGVDYTGIYKVSNTGDVMLLLNRRHVKSWVTGEWIWKNYNIEQLIGSNPDKNGYHKISLTKDGKKATMSVNRLMAEVFIRPLKKGEVAHHKNSNTSDNRLDNIKIITHRENCSIEKTIKSGTPVGVQKRILKNGKIKYITTITTKSFGNKTLNIGAYDSTDKASQCYYAALKYITGNTKATQNQTRDAVDFFRRANEMKPLRRFRKRK